MASFHKLKKEHQDIEIEIAELEAVLEAEELNFPNLIHSFNRLRQLWNKHEAKENKLFEKLKGDGVDLPFEHLFFDHRELRGHKKVLHDAIKTKSEQNILVALDTDGRMLIDKLRSHMSREDKLFDELVKKL